MDLLYMNAWRLGCLALVWQHGRFPPVHAYLYSAVHAFCYPKLLLLLLHKYSSKLELNRCSSAISLCLCTRPLNLHLKSSDGFVYVTPAVPCELYEFAEFPWPTHLLQPDQHPSSKVVWAYIQAYADHFKLNQHIRCDERSATNLPIISDGYCSQPQSFDRVNTRQLRIHLPHLPAQYSYLQSSFPTGFNASCYTCSFLRKAAGQSSTWTRPAAYSTS